LIARFNQKLGQPVGFLNPMLYAPALAGSAFHQITQGNNGAFSAGPGWNPCTGLGTPDGAHVLAGLSFVDGPNFDLEDVGGEERDAPTIVAKETTSQRKRPLIWIAERDGKEPPVRVGVTYPLHVQMGEPDGKTLVRGNAGDIPIDD